MADLTAFSSSTYNTAEWINAALDEVPAGDSLDSFISSLAMKLHIMSQDYTDQLETAMVESMSTMPRVLAEISRTEDQLKNVEAEMKALSAQLNTLNQRNVTGVEDLSRLDTLKSNMEKCKATLEEHARWSQLVREAKNLMEGGGRLSDSADRIETMFHSLAILKNLPGNEERQETCESFKKSLLTALRPIVRRDVCSVDTTPLQEYLHVFKKLGREFEMIEEYVKARPDSVRSMWDEYTPAQHPDFAGWLASYLGRVARLLTDEEEKTRSLFGDQQAPLVLCDLLVETLAPMTKMLGAHLAQFESPEVAFNAYCVVEEFAQRVVRLLQGAPDSKQQEALAAMYSSLWEFAPQYAESEASFAQMLLLRNIAAVSFADAFGGDASGSNSNIAGSGGLEEQLFGAEISDSDAYGAYGDRLLDSVESFRRPLKQALLRAGSMCGGLQVKSVLRALAGSLALYVRHLSGKLDDLRAASGLPRDSSITWASGGANGGGAGGESGGDGESKDGITAVIQRQAQMAEELARRLEMSGGNSDNHTLVVGALRGLQAVGRFCRRFAQLEAHTKKHLLELHTALCGSAALVPGQQSLSISALIAPIGAPGTMPLQQREQQQQPQSIGAAYAAVLLQRDEAQLTELKGFLVASSSISQHLSQNVFAAVASGPLPKLRHAAGNLLFSLCMEPPAKVLASLSADHDVWALLVADAEGGGEGDSSFEMLKENMLPQSTITQVGEHLLSLVQELEAFASDTSSNALRDLLALRGEAEQHTLSSAGWQQLKTTLDIRTDEGLLSICQRVKCAQLVATIETTLFGSSAAALTLAGAAADADADAAIAAAEDDVDIYPDSDGEDEQQQEDHGGRRGANGKDSDSAGAAAAGRSEELDAEAVLRFVNEWLGAVADAVVGLLLAQALDIPAFTKAGCAQMITDVEYLSNVINAMGLPPHPFLAHLGCIMGRDPAALVKAIDLLPTAKSKGATGHILKLDHVLITAIGKGHGLIEYSA